MIPSPLAPWARCRARRTRPASAPPKKSGFGCFPIWMFWYDAVSDRLGAQRFAAGLMTIVAQSNQRQFNAVPALRSELDRLF